MISLNINNINISLPTGSNIFQACLKLGITLPSFCYHEKLNIAGNCRMCLVELEKNVKPVAACAFPIINGLNIFTDTPLVKKARENILEFLLINHPLDCPICDRGGECDLQDQTFFFGKNSSRFFFKKRFVENKNYSPFIKTIMNRCIHCTRCIRYASEILNLPFYGTILRGNSTEISIYLSQIFKTEMAGNIIDLCPVGALTSKPYAFRGRPWELDRFESIDIFDTFGANICIFYKNFNIIRILPGINKNYQNEWISDRIRFSYDALTFNRILCFFTKIKNNLKSLSFLQMENNLLIEERQQNIFNLLYKKRYTRISTYYFFFGNILSHIFLEKFKKFNYLSFFIKNKSFITTFVDSRNFFLLQNFNIFLENNILLVNTQYKEIIPNFNLEIIKLVKNFKKNFLFLGLNLTTPSNLVYINLFFTKNFYFSLLSKIRKESLLFLYHFQKYSRIDLPNQLLFLNYLNLIFFKNNQISFTFTDANQILKSELNLQFNYNWFFFKNNFLKKNSKKILNFNDYFFNSIQKNNQNMQKNFFFGHHLNFAFQNDKKQYFIPIKTFFEEQDYFINMFGLIKKYNSKIKLIKNIFSLNDFFNKFLFKNIKIFNKKKFFTKLNQKLLRSPINYINLTLIFQKKYKCFLTLQPYELTNSFKINNITKASLNLLKAFDIFELKSNFN